MAKRECGMSLLSSPFERESFVNQDLDGQKRVYLRFAFLLILQLSFLASRSR